MQGIAVRENEYVHPVVLSCQMLESNRDAGLLLQRIVEGEVLNLVVVKL
jgi:hypothetical protein